MRFRRYSPEIAHVDKVVVDGNECGIGLQFSHWPGSTTPTHLKADLSVEIVLRFLTDPAREEMLAGRDIVTNDHYDTDGVLAAWAMLEPETALRHATALIQAAEAGDFYEFTTPEAFKANLAIEALGDPDSSPLAGDFAGRPEHELEQAAHELIFPQLPDLLYDASRYEALWRRDYEAILARIQRLNGGGVRVTEWPEESLSVIQVPDKLDHFARNVYARGQRILEASPRDGGTAYALYYRELLWYDIVSRATTPRHLMTRTAERLNELEPASGDGSWCVTNWTPALFFIASGPRKARMVKWKEPQGASRLKLDAVEHVVREELRSLDAEAARSTRPSLAGATD